MSMFEDREDVLATHRGYDIGIARVVRRLAKMTGWPLIEFPVSRLLVEPNRSQRHRVFSEFAKELSFEEKQQLIDTYYAPYRQQVSDTVKSLSPCLHLSLHSFTPIWQGTPRTMDAGVLYDPSRSSESQIANQIKHHLEQDLDLKVRRNAPYLGISDGLCTWLRKQTTPADYLGIELELNQAFLGSASSNEVDKLCGTFKLLY